MIVLLVAFTTGTIVQTVNAATMSAMMMLGDITETNMDDCQGCPDDFGDKSSSCDSDCVITLMATIQPSKDSFLVAHSIENFSAIVTAVGRTGLPEPHPPKFIFLS